MYRELLTNKWVLSGISFLIVLSVACVFWYYYDVAPYTREFTKSEELLRQLSTFRKTKDATGTKQITERTSVDTDILTVEKTKTDTTGTVKNSEVNTKVSSINTELTSNANEKETKVSPYGYGPYPDVPQGFINAIGKPFWLLPDEILRQRRKPPSRNVELMQRVMVKLWKQGRTDVEAAFMDGDKVIVIYKNRAYVRYGSYTNSNGENVRYISSWRAGSAQSPKPAHGSVYPPGEKDIDPSIELIDLDKDDPGINPYEFLGLN